jgi:hypothetical protein
MAFAVDPPLCECDYMICILAKYAATKSELADNMSLGMIEFSEPWQVCPGCHQDYKNELAIDIANKVVLFVRRQYPEDTQMHVDALHMKLHALISMLNRLQPRQKREAGVTANVLLSLIDRMKNESPLPIQYSRFEADAYNVHGCIALNEGTEESARRAVVHFEKYLKVCEAIGYVEGIANAKHSIAVAKSKYEGGINNEEVVKISKELYELCVAKHGEENEYIIHLGKIYASDLQKANRGDEARELLTKLLATSKQILGSHHNTTKEIESKLE